MPVYPDLEACLNDTAMTVEAIPVGVGKYGNAAVEFPISAIPPSLDFCAKWTTSVTAGVTVSISFFNNGILQYSEFWNNPEIEGDWTQISMPLEQIEPVITDARIDVISVVGDLVPGSAEITVDDMRFGEAQGLTDSHLTELLFSPNPVADIIQLQDVRAPNASYIILDTKGRTVQLGTIIESNIDVRGLPAGTYFLRILEGEKIVGTARFLKQ